MAKARILEPPVPGGPRRTGHAPEKNHLRFYWEKTKRFSNDVTGPPGTGGSNPSSRRVVPCRT